MVPDTELCALVGVVGPIIQVCVVVREGLLEEGVLSCELKEERS